MPQKGQICTRDSRGGGSKTPQTGSVLFGKHQLDIITLFPAIYIPAAQRCDLCFPHKESCPWVFSLHLYVLAPSLLLLTPSQLLSFDVERQAEGSLRPWAQLHAPWKKSGDHDKASPSDTYNLGRALRSCKVERLCTLSGSARATHTHTHSFRLSVKSITERCLDGVLMVVQGCGLYALVCMRARLQAVLFARTSPGVSVPVLGQGVLKRPFLQALDTISPVWWRHAAVGVQQDPEAPDYQQSQEHQQHPHEGKRCLLLQSQRVRHHVVSAHGSKGVVVVDAAHGKGTARRLISPLMGSGVDRPACYLDRDMTAACQCYPATGGISSTSSNIITPNVWACTHGCRKYRSRSWTRETTAMALDVLNSADHETAINSLRSTRYQTDVPRLRSFSLFHDAPLGILQRIAKDEWGRLREKWVQGYESMSGLHCIKSGGIVSQCIGSCETSAKRKGAPESMASRWSCSLMSVSSESKGFSTCCMWADVCQPAWLHQPRKWKWWSKHVHHAAPLADVWAPSSKNISREREQQVVQASE